MSKSILIVFLIICFSSCSTESINGTDTSDKTDYRSIFFGLKNLRLGESYCLWLKPHKDSSYVLIGVIQPNTSLDSLVQTGTLSRVITPDTFISVVVTIERTSKPMTPGIILLTGIIRSDKKQTDGKDSIYALLSVPFLDPLTKTSGGVTFTSTSSDTTSYLREFYLLKFRSGEPEASLQDLPTPTPGWIYGLWVYDDNFFPPHQFLYGTFRTPIGHDTDSTDDAYPFPGGIKKQQLNIGSGVIRVTYEPDLYGDSLRYKGISPFGIIEVARKQFIDRNKYYEMVNIADMSFPYGAVSFKRR